jgi:hypothetical protein
VPTLTRTARSTVFTLTWEGEPADDGEPDDAQFLGNFAHRGTACDALVLFCETAHADFHGGTVCVRDGRGNMVLGVALPLPVRLEVLV